MLNIGDRTSKYVKVWEVEDKGNFAKVKLGSSSKDKDGNYKNSTWFASFVGQAKDPAYSLSEGDLIEITNGGIENVWSKEHEKAFLNVVVFGFETMQSSNGGGDFSSDSAPDDDLPWNN